LTTILDPGAVPGDSTINTPPCGPKDGFYRRFGICRSRILRCVYDGVEIGSTGRIEEWSYRDVSAVTANKLIIANSNFKPELFFDAEVLEAA